MVFCGKPSRGCSNCRARKIKCDQIEPACAQCIKAHQICPGYRDQLELMFRDESEDVARKARARQADKGLQRGRRAATAQKKAPDPSVKAATSPQSNKPSPSPTEELELTLRSRVLSPSAEEQATCFFFHSYVESGLTRGQLSHLPTLPYESLQNGALSVTITSVGMAALSNIQHNPDALLTARAKYSSALSLTNAALKNPVEVGKDETLSAVLLLGMFETLTCNTPQSMKSWSSHIDGAAALLKLRGQKQFERRAGLLMFLQLRRQILTSCLQREIHVPSIIIELSQLAQNFQSEAEIPGNRFSEIVIQFCNLRASIKDGSIVDEADIMNSVLAVDGDLAAWVRQIKVDWAYTTVKEMDQSEDTYEGQYHIYASFANSAIWNNYRTIRILVNECVLYCLNRLPATSSSDEDERNLLRLRSRTILDQMASDICASVPYLFDLGELGNSRSPPAPARRSAGGFSLLWPLYTAASMEGARRAMSVWIIRQLEKIGHGLGIQQALALARVLRTAFENPSVLLAKKNRMEGMPVKESSEDSSDNSGEEFIDWQEEMCDEWQLYLGEPSKYF